MKECLEGSNCANVWLVDLWVVVEILVEIIAEFPVGSGKTGRVGDQGMFHFANGIGASGFQPFQSGFGCLHDVPDFSVDDASDDKVAAGFFLC